MALHEMPERASYRSLALSFFRSWKKSTREFRARRGDFCRILALDKKYSRTLIMEIMGELTRINPHQSSTPIVRRVAIGPSNFHDLIPCVVDCPNSSKLYPSVTRSRWIMTLLKAAKKVGDWNQNESDLFRLQP